MSVREDLIAAKAMIDTPEKWRQDGESGYGTSQLCTLGACGSVGGDFHGMARALRCSLPPEKGHWVSIFNDRSTTTHADIMSLFDRAIEAAK